jgi:hypothetical protein
MKLKDYLTKHNIKNVRFAESIGYGEVYTGKVINGKVLPGYKLVKIIEQVTKGAVKEGDYELKEKKK